MLQANFDKNRSGPPAYHFFTRILRVNRLIHDEAEELLHKCNSFIVINYAWHGLGRALGGLCWLPIVSNKHVGGMREHSLSIKVSSGEEGPANANSQAFVLLASDLRSFCLVMALMGVMKDSSGIAASVSRDSVLNPVHKGNKPAMPAIFECELRDTKHRPMSLARQHEMLAPMALILAPSQQVSFTGDIRDYQHTDHLRNVMSPSFICTHAQRWAMFEILTLAKDIAAAAAEHDDVDYVHGLHLNLLQAIEIATFKNVSFEHHMAFSMAFPETTEAMFVLELETMVYTACAALKDKTIVRFCNENERIRRLLVARGEQAGQPGYQKETPAGLKGLCAHLGLLELIHGRSTNAPSHISIKFCLLAASFNGSGPWQKHDWDILKRQPNQDSSLSPQHLPLDQCSVVKFPLPDYSYSKILLQQDRFEGWLDKELVRSFSEDFKKKIGGQQKRYGLKVTDFDKLGL